MAVSHRTFEVEQGNVVCEKCAEIVDDISDRRADKSGWYTDTCTCIRSEAAKGASRPHSPDGPSRRLCDDTCAGAGGGGVAGA